VVQPKESESKVLTGSFIKSLTMQLVNSNAAISLNLSYNLVESIVCIYLTIFVLQLLLRLNRTFF